MSKILTVDDSRIIRRIISGAVELLGFEVLEAENGQMALEELIAHGEEVKLILLDWNMPVMDGYSTLEAIKADPKTRGIPVMMVTTEAEKTNVIKAIKAGASHYLTKPFTQEDLMSRMLECLQAVEV